VTALRSCRAEARSALGLAEFVSDLLSIVDRWDGSGRETENVVATASNPAKRRQK
jgi:hypothetical protein